MKLFAQQNLFSAILLFLLLTFSATLLPLSLQAAGQNASLQVLSESMFQQQKNGKIWQMDRSKKLRTQEDVETYLVKLNQGESKDWRLPTRQELFDLFSIFDLKDNGEVKIRLEGSYWLEDEPGTRYAGAWEIGDQCGPTRSYYPDKAGYVRAIRP